MTELLWGKEPARTRGPKPAITLTAIAEVAIAIADAEGLDAVSMQRVAGELPVTKMALYRYVPGKTELVAVMSDLAMGGPPDRPDLPWREALRTWAIDLYDGFARHPWLLQSTIGRRLLGPNELAWVERGVAALTGTGLSGGEQLDSILVITSHVRNIAQQSTTFPGHTTGLTEEDMAAVARRDPHHRGGPVPASDHRDAYVGGQREPGAGVRPGADPGRPGAADQ